MVIFKKIVYDKIKVAVNFGRAFSRRSSEHFVIKSFYPKT